jgi:hypothetical protein
VVEKQRARDAARATSNWPLGHVVAVAVAAVWFDDGSDERDRGVTAVQPSWVGACAAIRPSIRPRTRDESTRTTYKRISA